MLKGKVGEMTMETELLREKIGRLEAGVPLAAVEAMSRVARCWKLSDRVSPSPAGA